MAMYCGVDGAKRTLSKIFSGVDGAARELNELWAGQEGANRLVFKAAAGGGIVHVTNNKDKDLVCSFIYASGNAENKMVRASGAASTPEFETPEPAIYATFFYYMGQLQLSHSGDVQLLKKNYPGTVFTVEVYKILGPSEFSVS